MLCSAIYKVGTVTRVYSGRSFSPRQQLGRGGQHNRRCTREPSICSSSCCCCCCCCCGSCGGCILLDLAPPPLLLLRHAFPVLPVTPHCRNEAPISRVNRPRGEGIVEEPRLHGVVKVAVHLHRPPRHCVATAIAFAVARMLLLFRRRADRAEPAVPFSQRGEALRSDVRQQVAAQRGRQQPKQRQQVVRRVRGVQGVLQQRQLGAVRGEEHVRDHVHFSELQLQRGAVGGAAQEKAARAGAATAPRVSPLIVTFDCGAAAGRSAAAAHGPLVQPLAQARLQAHGKRVHRAAVSLVQSVQVGATAVREQVREAAGIHFKSACGRSTGASTL